MYFIGSTETAKDLFSTTGSGKPLVQRTVYDIIAELYNSLGLTTFIIIVFIIGLLILLYKMAEIFVIKFAESRFKVSLKKNRSNLSKHIALDKLDSVINYQIDSIHMPCPLRSRIFKRILIMRFETIKELLEAMTTKDWDITRDALKIVWEDFFANVETTWDRKVDQARIPKVVISRFYEMRSPTNKVLRELTANMCLRSNRDIKESISIIFDTIVTIETSSLYTIADTLGSLNGEISNTTFEGVSCQNCASVEECNTKEG
jgi:hypothetical protein